MSSYFDDASLVMIPSGYKDQKVYSVKPLDGSGDLTFSRASSATRVASNGYIEKVRTNLALYSQDFTNAAWSINNNLTITSNNTTAPDGTNTADLAYINSSNNFCYLAQMFTASSNVYTLSIYAKAQNKNVIWLYIEASGAYGICFFDLSDGTTSITAGGTSTPTSTMTSVGNGWYKCTFTLGSSTALLSGSGFGVCDAKGSTYGTASGTSGVYTWGAQLETGDIATDYIATTSAAVSVGPVSGLPRLDYLNSTCPRLLLEPQRTNVLTYSEQLNNAAWALDGNGAGQSVTANYAVSPDGYTNADRVQLNRTGGTYSRLRQDYVAAGNHTGAIYLKSNTGASQKIWMRVNGSAVVKITITTSWQRFVVSQGSSAAFELFIDNTDAEIATIADFSAWGAQLEAGAYATSYIPTLGTSVTRVADAASKTGISSLIGQQEGTLYWEGVLPQVGEGGPSNSSNILNSARNINSNSGFSIQHINGSNSVSALFFVGDGTFTPKISLSAGSLPSGTYAKIAFAYKSGSSALYVNGVLAQSSSVIFTSSTTISEIYLNDLNVYFGYPAAQADAQVLLFPTRLSNSDLAALTA
jgi:hypothetical protein